MNYNLLLIEPYLLPSTISTFMFLCWELCIHSQSNDREIKKIFEAEKGFGIRSQVSHRW